ncbi:MAG TPA: hypothetical protein VHC22_24385 [Pirellulales bacterium]|nr:hypothetical protein [Pirellulales bacterium]
MSGTSRRWSTRDAASALTAFALTMLVLPRGLEHGLGPPRSAEFEAKWADFERRADDCDVVFVGTSHVARHIDPQVFDAALAEQDWPARSYNLGLPKMSMLEGSALVERIVHRRPRRLKLVVVEPTLYIYDADNWATDRALAVHDWAGTRTAVHLTWASETRRGTSVWGKIQCISPHVLSYLCRACGLRCGARLFTASSESPVSSNEPPRDTAGFAPLPVERPVGVGQTPPAWQERFTRFSCLTPDWSGAPLSSAELAYFDGLTGRLRSIGAEPVFLLGPKMKRDSHTAAIWTSHRLGSVDAPLVDYLRGHCGQEIYRMDYWHDFDHLNADGATLFSRRLAIELSRMLSIAYQTAQAAPLSPRRQR